MPSGGFCGYRAFFRKNYDRSDAGLVTRLKRISSMALRHQNIRFYDILIIGMFVFVPVVLAGAV